MYLLYIGTHSLEFRVSHFLSWFVKLRDSKPGIRKFSQYDRSNTPISSELKASTILYSLPMWTDDTVWAECLCCQSIWLVANPFSAAYDDFQFWDLKLNLRPSACSHINQGSSGLSNDEESDNWQHELSKGKQSGHAQWPPSTGCESSHFDYNAIMPMLGDVLKKNFNGPSTSPKTSASPWRDIIQKSTQP